MNRRLCDDLYRESLKLVQQRACEGVSIETILEVLPASRQTIEHAFTRHLGRTPGQEMARLRMERARQLLTTTESPVKNIAALIGYRQVASFCRFFRLHAGISPQAYRTMHHTASRGGTSASRSLGTTNIAERKYRMPPAAASAGHSRARGEHFENGISIVREKIWRNSF
jgi:AraC-like DNA-binding protein